MKPSNLCGRSCKWVPVVLWRQFLGAPSSLRAEALELVTTVQDHNRHEVCRPSWNVLPISGQMLLLTVGPFINKSRVLRRVVPMTGRLACLGKIAWSRRDSKSSYAFPFWSQLPEFRSFFAQHVGPIANSRPLPKYRGERVLCFSQGASCLWVSCVSFSESGSARIAPLRFTLLKNSSRILSRIFQVAQRALGLTV